MCWVANSVESFLMKRRLVVLEFDEWVGDRCEGGFGWREIGIGEGDVMSLMVMEE